MFKIRPATEKDALGIVKVREDSIKYVAAKDYTEVQITDWIGDRKPENYVQVMANGEDMFVAEDNAKNIIGFSSYKNCEVRAVYVSSQAIGEGVGRALYQAVEQLARDKNCRELCLSSSVTALEFYQKQGFSITEEAIHRSASGIESLCFKMIKPL